MFSQRYEKLNNYVSPSSELVNKVKNLYNRKNTRFNRVLLKPAIVMIF